MSQTSLSCGCRASAKTVVRPAGHKGAGVYAAQAVARGELIERAAVLVIPGHLALEIIDEEIGNYVFEWATDDVAIALGTGSFYNHSYSPNAVYEQNYSAQSIDFVALEAIARGSEILVNYNQDPSDRSSVWFDVFS